MNIYGLLSSLGGGDFATYGQNIFNNMSGRISPNTSYLKELLLPQAKGGDPNKDRYRKTFEKGLGRSSGRAIKNIYEQLASSGFRGAGANLIGDIFEQESIAKSGFEDSLLQRDVQIKQNAINQLLGVEGMELGAAQTDRQSKLALIQMLMGGAGDKRRADLMLQQIEASKYGWGDFLGQLLSAGATVGAALLTGGASIPATTGRYLDGDNMSFLNQFVRSFNIQPATNILAQGILTDKEHKRNQAKEEKRRKQQSDILGELISGGAISGGKTPSMSPEGVERPNETEFVTHSPKVLGSLLSQLDTDTLAKYKTWQELNKKPEIKKVDIFTDAEGNKRRYILNKEGNAYVPDMSPEGIISEKKKIPTSSYVMEERIGNKFRTLYGYENPDADSKDKSTRIIGDKKYTVTRVSNPYEIYKQKTKDNGDNYNTLSKDVKKLLNDYYIKQQVLSAQLKSGVENTDKYDELGRPIKTKDKLIEHNKIYSNLVDNVMDDEAKSWWETTYNEEGKDENGEILKPAKSNPHPADFWDKLKNDYKKERISESTFEIQVEKFKAIYGFDPLRVYGL